MPTVWAIHRCNNAELPIFGFSATMKGVFVMKKFATWEESKFLRLFFACISVCFVVAAFFMPDRSSAFTGLREIVTNTCKIATNYFALGGYAATFLNMGLVGLFCTALCFLPGAKPNNVTTLGVLLTIGFGSWGINPLNMIPTILGVCLFCLVKKEKLGAMSNAMMYSTGIAPLISDLLFRYPSLLGMNIPEGFSWMGLGLAVFVGLIIGFFLPAGLGHAPNIHKGFNHYSAAVPIGFTAFFLRSALFTVMGVALPAAPKYEVVTQSFMNTNIFCFVVFGLCIVFALLMGCKFKDYWNLMKDSGHGVSFTTKYGNAPFLMNVGVFGLMIVGYYNLAMAISGTEVWTGMTFGIVFCMLATCNSGSHPRNVWPIMVGYILTSLLFGLLYRGEGDFVKTMGVGSQSILIGLCYANGMSPISGKYGFPFGILAGGLHYLLVTAVPSMHGGFCLYNGGFTAALICLLFVPQLEKFFKTKEERRLAKQSK